jgi:signal transduction histidine kinase
MFVWFWLVMAVVIAIIVVLDRTTERDPTGTPMYYALQAPLTYYGRMAVEAAERGDRPALAATLDRLRSSTAIAPYLFDERMSEIQGNTVPPDVVKLAAKARRTGKPAFLFFRDKMMAAFDVGKDKKREYTIAGIVPGEALPKPRSEMLFLLPRLGVALVISCLACYLLARYMTSPMTRLGNAARRLASGDLGVRVSPAAGKRWDEIGELAHDFDLMAERIQTLLISQQQLLGNISHELRSPLARLNVALELARRHSTPEAGKSLDRIEWEAERLNDMIGQLLTLTRLESGMGRTKEEPVDLAGLVRDIAADADFEAGGRNRSVRLVENDACTITGSRDLLRSAIENVVRNAVWYTKEGTAVDLGLHASPNERHALVTVRDHGPGVPEEALPHLFRPFYRVGEARERQTGGTGLGLAITERAVLLHGGKIKAWNSPEGGLVVQMTLGPVFSG